MEREYDYPLAETQVIWDPVDNNLPPVDLVRLPFEDDSRYENSWGACNLEFQQASSAEKLEMLFAQFVYISVADKIAPTDIHRAFSLIPEYRQALSKIGFSEPN